MLGKEMLASANGIEKIYLTITLTVGAFGGVTITDPFTRAKITAFDRETVTKSWETVVPNSLRLDIDNGWGLEVTALVGRVSTDSGTYIDLLSADGGKITIDAYTMS